MRPLYEWAPAWGLTYHQARRRAERGTLRYPYSHPRRDQPVAIWRDPASGRRYVIDPDDAGYSQALTDGQLVELHRLVSAEVRRRGINPSEYAE